MKDKVIALMAIIMLTAYVIALSGFCYGIYTTGVALYGDTYKQDLKRNFALVGTAEADTVQHNVQFNYLFNRYREVHGVHNLGNDTQLADCASVRATEIVSSDNFSHDGWQDDYCDTDIHGENLAKNYHSIDALRAWVQSPSHNDNLLSTQYTNYGLGIHENITVLLLN